MITVVVSSLERCLNALLDESTAARERLADLEGASLGLRLVGPGIELTVRAAQQRLHVAHGLTEPADAVLSGTPLALLELWHSGNAADFESSGARLAGDAQTLEAFVRLFELLLPDLEELLARVSGDVTGHELARAARSTRAWMARAIDALLVNTAEFLQEESRDLPARAEAEDFYRDVERLRDDVARASARAERLGVTGRPAEARGEGS